MIRIATVQDVPAILEIYRPYILQTTHTFEYEVPTLDAFLERFGELTDAIGQIPYMCGYCYTQVSDVQQEINGLMDVNRNYKVDPEEVRAINLRQKRGVF